MLPARHCDRFIPVRSARDVLLDHCYSAQKKTEASSHYSRIISPQSRKYLQFATPHVSKNQSLTDFIFKSLPKKKKTIRDQEVRKATKILDAPDVITNFYYNPLDWSPSGKVGVALTDKAYLLSEDKEAEEIQRHSHIHITSLRFHQGDSLCLLGDNSGRVDVYDVEGMNRIRQINVHYNRVGVIQHSDIPQAFLTGSKDKLIKLNDLRLKKTDVATMEKHQGEICGLSTTKHYLASGGNDNKVVIWDLRKFLPISQMTEHRSAVKAIAWCPWKSNLLASGGGCQDRRIILWNGNKNVIEQKIETQNQIVALQWKEDTRQLISGHSSMKNSCCLVWNGNNVVMKLTGHNGKLLGMKVNPITGNQLCTLASDETMRFWDISERQKAKMNIKKTNSTYEGDCR